MSLISLLLTPLRPTTLLVRPASAVARPIGTAISVRLPFGVVTQMAQDVHSISQSTHELTATIDELDAIRSRVETLETEVTRMRQAVESMGADVAHVRESTEPLGRMAGRFARRRRVDPEAL